MNPLKMKFNEFVEWAIGYVLLGIGRGDGLHVLMHTVIDHALCNGVFSEKGIYIRLEKAIQGCLHCEYDEAEGVLWNHCDDCRLKVTAEVMKIVNGK